MVLLAIFALDHKRDLNNGVCTSMCCLANVVDQNIYINEEISCFEFCRMVIK